MQAAAFGTPATMTGGISCTDRPAFTLLPLCQLQQAHNHTSCCCRSSKWAVPTFKRVARPVGIDSDSIQLVDAPLPMAAHTAP